MMPSLRDKIPAYAVILITYTAVVIIWLAVVLMKRGFW